MCAVLVWDCPPKRMCQLQRNTFSAIPLHSPVQTLNYLTMSRWTLQTGTDAQPPAPSSGGPRPSPAHLEEPLHGLQFERAPQYVSDVHGGKHHLGIGLASPSG